MKHLFYLLFITLTLSAPGQVPGDTLAVDSSIPLPVIMPQSGGSFPGLTLKNDNGQFRNLPPMGNYALVILSSPSCPIWNGQTAYIDQWLQSYPYIDPYFILTPEAHPDTSTGENWQKYRHGSAYPLMGPDWWPDRAASTNRAIELRLPNPVTYGDRIGYADTIRQRWNPVPQILIDDPANTAWKSTGRIPAGMWLLDPTGTVLYATNFFNFMPSQGEPTRHALDDALQVATGIDAPVGDDVHLMEFDGYRWEKVDKRKANRMYKGVGK